MSDEQDKSKPGRSHDHGHPAIPTPPEPAAQEDASSRALAEALRSSFAIVQVVMAALVVVFLGSGFFKVQEGQRAIRLHFGKPVGEGNNALLGPGLHWSWPYPVDDVVKIPYAQLQQVKSTVGWYNTTPEAEAIGPAAEPPPGPSLRPAVDGYTITGDENIIHTRATLFYRIEDPIQYHFGFTNAPETVQNALDNALLFASARFKVDDALTRDKVRFQDTVKERVTELTQLEKLGIVVESCQVESIQPRYLKAQFESVLTAQTTRDKNLNDALSYSNQVVSKAQEDAASRTNSARAERKGLVKTIEAEAQLFTDLLPDYKTNATLFTAIHLNETISDVMTNVQDKVYLPERADGKPWEVRLQLSREPQKPASAQP